MELLMRCSCGEWIWIKPEGWLAIKVQVRAFALGTKYKVIVREWNISLVNHFL